MSIVTLSHKNFQETVSDSGIVVVDCWAAWCGACKAFAPTFEKTAAKYPQHTFGTLDTQAEKELVTKLGIEHIPTLLLYRDGILLFKNPGYFDEEKMADIVSQAEGLDMDAVRADIAAEKDSS